MLLFHFAQNFDNRTTVLKFDINYSLLYNLKKLVIISLIIVLIVFTITNKQKQEKGDNGNLKTAVSEIELNSKQYINQLEKVKIKGTNDTLVITKQVKWQVPEHDPDMTVSFSIAVPYTIIVDGHEYNGVYKLNDSDWNTSDNNPKYDFKVTNLTKNGDIEILISNK